MKKILDRIQFEDKELIVVEIPSPQNIPKNSLRAGRIENNKTGPYLSFEDYVTQDGDKLIRYGGASYNLSDLIRNKRYSEVYDKLVEDAKNRGIKLNLEYGLHLKKNQN
jgi:hypothetical protein